MKTLPRFITTVLNAPRPLWARFHSLIIRMTGASSSSAPSFLVELCTAPRRSGETLQSEVETQFGPKRGPDPLAVSSKAACRLPPSFRSTDEIRSKFGRTHPTGDHGKRRHRFLTRRCSDDASSRAGRSAPGLVVQFTCFRAQLSGRASIIEWDRSSARLYTNLCDTGPFPARNHRRSYGCLANQGPGSEALY